MYYGGGNRTRVNEQNTPLTSDFVSLSLKGREDGFSLKGGDATRGSLKTMYDGPRPDKKIAADCGDTYHYQPMRKQGAIILGTGGDNSVLSMPSCPSQFALLDSLCTAAVSLTRAMSERRAGQFLRGIHGQRLRL